MNVHEFYQEAIDKRGFQVDAAQKRAVDRLQQSYDDWVAYKAKRSNRLVRLISRPEVPRGVYMWGGVGRGKSFLMDSFYSVVPVVRKTRLHFHEFMRAVHRELDELKGVADPLNEVAARIAAIGPVVDGSMNAEQVGAFLRSESTRWAAITKEIGVLPE